MAEMNKEGYIFKETGFMMLGKTRPGTCPECGVVHDPAQPHNKDSLTYQYNFYDEHGRWPTWRDAMAHCAPEIQEAWCQALTEKGAKLD
ncbi:MAG: hypothetical protein LUD50_04530 [Clostridia bacterium]|nr:hypothetical protein [Clostridia bacterium]